MTDAIPGVDACHLGPEGREAGCITCGDVAVPLRVVEVETTGDARCVDDAGREELVAVDLVGPVSPSDRLLVHARVAIERLPTDAEPESGRPVTPDRAGGDLR